MEELVKILLSKRPLYCDSETDHEEPERHDAGGQEGQADPGRNEDRPDCFHYKNDNA